MRLSFLPPTRPAQIPNRLRIHYPYSFPFAPSIRNAAARLDILASARMLVLMFAVALAGNANAQKQPELDYVIQFIGSIDPTQAKAIHSVLHDEDPYILVSIDRDLLRAKVRTRVQLSHDGLQAAFAAFGLTVDFILVANEGHPEERMSLELFNTGFPAYVNTGDPDLDAANYAASKDTWVIANPGLYEQLLLNSGTVATPGSE